MPMNPDFDNLLKKIFQVNKLEEVDVLSMEQLAGQHPYFAPLQYLLAKKYNQLSDAQYGLQIAKTAIFFSNPHWLNDLLSFNEEATNLKEDIENAGGKIVEEQNLQALPSQPIAIEHISEEVPELKHNELSEAFPEQNKDAEPSGEEQGQPVVEDNILPLDFESPVLVDEVSEPQALTNHLEQDSEAPVSESAFEDNLEKPSSETPEEEGWFSATQHESVDQEIIPAELQEDIYSNIPESFPENTEGQELAQEAETLEDKPGLSVDDDEDYKTETAVPGSAIEVTAPRTLQPEETTIPSQLIKPGSLLLPDAGNLPLIPIEPLYAVDYFASQGIKLINDDGKDKLSQKLRSFTEWLKTMKRIHPEKLEQEMDSRSSTVIQHIPEHSNELEHVVTEAMAEVYARQGLRNKAAEVYQKLSLLNPNKRTYFAARISKLNET